VSPSGRRLRQVVAVFRACVHRPPLSLRIDEPAPLGNRLAAMAGMANTGVNEPEAPVGLDVEGLGIVAHTGDLIGWMFRPTPGQEGVGGG
jgi:hypothetical protein